MPATKLHYIRRVQQRLAMCPQSVLRGVPPESCRNGPATAIRTWAIHRLFFRVKPWAPFPLGIMPHRAMWYGIRWILYICTVFGCIARRMKMAYELTQERRDEYRATSIRSQQRKQAFLRENHLTPVKSPLRGQRLDPVDLMPQLDRNGLTCLSLFSGGGGLDVGFEQAGFDHQACFELLDVCGQTLRANPCDLFTRSV